MNSTYKNMTLEYLGDNATEADLARFRTACESRQRQTEESDETVTEWMWSDGDWESRVSKYV